MLPVTTDRVVLEAAGQAPLLPAARAAFLAALDEGWADPRRLSQIRIEQSRPMTAAATDVGQRTRLAQPLARSHQVEEIAIPPEIALRSEVFYGMGFRLHEPTG